MSIANIYEGHSDFCQVAWTRRVRGRGSVLHRTNLEDSSQLPIFYFFLTRLYRTGRLSIHETTGGVSTYWLLPSAPFPEQEVMADLEDTQTYQCRTNIPQCLNDQLVGFFLANDRRTEILADTNQGSKSLKDFCARDAIKLRDISYLEIAAGCNL